MLFRTLRNNAAFLLPYMVLLLAVLPVLSLYNKEDIHLWINGHYSAFGDTFFRIITFMGDGLFFILPACIMLFFSARHLLFLMSSYLGTGLAVQLLKRLAFPHVARPSVFLQDHSLHLVDGVTLLQGRSFPSGHAASAFSLFLCIALLADGKTVKFLCLVMATLVAFSRVYLSQHFLADIYAGSLIGTSGTLAFYLLFYGTERPWYSWRVQKLFSHEKKT